MQEEEFDVLVIGGGITGAGVALDADAQDPASIEKALRALVDSNPAQYGAPSSQLAKISVNILPSIQAGQGASIIAVFRQAVTGADNDGSPYMLAVSGKSLTFHIKVFKDGKPVLMSTTGELAAGVTPDAMTVAFDDGQLAAIAAKRAQLPPDSANASGGSAKSFFARRISPQAAYAQRKGKPAPRSKKKPKTKTKTAPRTKTHPRQGKTKPRGGSSDDQAAAGSSEEPAPAAPTFLTRELTDELDGKWRAVNIYQAAGPQGAPLIVIVDVKTGEAFAVSANSLHTGEEASGRTNLISGTVTGRGTLPTADGGDHGPIGPIALPLTNVYDQNGKVVAVTDESRATSRFPTTGPASPSS